MALINTSFALLLGSDSNEGAFSIRSVKGGFCFSGRMERGESQYDALVGVCRDDKCKVWYVGSGRDDFSYSVERYGEGCLALVTTLSEGDMDLSLVFFDEKGARVVRHFEGSGDEMGWYLKRVKGGFLLVGGVREDDWDILVVRLDGELNLIWSRRLGTKAQEYAYSAVEEGDAYYVVGRTDLGGDWDAFVLILSRDGSLRASYRTGTPAKDYLRYIGLVGGKPFAVGRSELRDDSDILVLDVISWKALLIDGGGFDYGRVFAVSDRSVLIAGDSYRGTDPDGFVILAGEDFTPLRGWSVGGEDVESIRFITEEALIAGYSYSFSLNNDMMLGRFDPSCHPFVREKGFKAREVKLRTLEYPLRVTRHKLKEVRSSLTTGKVELDSRDVCRVQE